MTVQQKNVTAFPVTWRVPGLLCGNELPIKWIDVGNALLRRFLIVEFPNRPERSDPMLDSKLAEEMALIMVKVNRLYRNLVSRLGGKSIDEALPSYFHEKLEKFQKKTQPFLAMIDEHPELDRGDTKRIMLVELKTMFKEFLQLNNMRNIPLDEDEMIRQLRAKIGPDAVRVIPKDQPIEYNGREQHGTFVFGLGIRYNDELDVDADSLAEAGFR